VKTDFILTIIFTSSWVTLKNKQIIKFVGSFKMRKNLKFLKCVKCAFSNYVNYRSSPGTDHEDPDGTVRVRWRWR